MILTDLKRLAHIIEPILDPYTIRKDFPILSRTLKDRKVPLIYFDNAATTQKPRQVIEALAFYYRFQKNTQMLR